MQKLVVADLKPGGRYVFHIKPFVPPTGKPVAELPRERTFVGIEMVGAVGLEPEQFIEVKRDDGSRHLIAVCAIDTIEPA